MQNEALQRAKGVRDFGPAEKISRDRIINILKNAFELFGYNPIETPVLERFELFASKYGIGQESDAMRESFKLKDQGDRDLVLRTEFTVPFARFVGMNPQLRLPFKRYQIGTVFRDGPIKLGRYREFYQCDVDVVGISNVSIDAEILSLINKVFADLNLEVEIRINNRKLLNNVLAFSGVPADKQISAIIAMDKLDKIGEKGVKKELLEKDIADNVAETFLATLDCSGTNEEIIQKLENVIGQTDGLNEIKQTLQIASTITNVKFLPSLARGLAYYTGNVFEVFLKDTSQISSSICGGGRYDKMIGGFIGTKDEYPAIGVSFGLETIFDAMKLVAMSQDTDRSVVKTFIVSLDQKYAQIAFDLAVKLRQNKINVDLDYSQRKLGKNMEYANSYNIPWVIIIGEAEAQENFYTLKNMLSGQQEKCSIEQLLQKLQ